MSNTNCIEWLRRAELALAILILAFGVLFRTVDISGVVPDSEFLNMALLYGVFFFLPLGLAIVSVLSAVFAKSNARSYLIGTVATVMLLGVLGSWAMFFFPGGGGGVQVGHLLSFAFGLLLAVVVLLKQTTTLVLAKTQRSVEV